VKMSDTTAPKSDQLNADDMVSGPKTITITGVEIKMGDQPVSIFYEGDNGKPFKPCKGMRRIMVEFWGDDANAYFGRSLTLYRDPTVTWSGAKIGGARISHMSHIDGPKTTALTISKAVRKPYTVQPLTVGAPAKTAASPQDDRDAARAAAKQGTDAFRAWWGARTKDQNAHLMPHVEELRALCAAADADPFGLPPLDATPTPEQVAAAMADAEAQARAQGE
jgi:hypothetical protein